MKDSLIKQRVIVSSRYSSGAQERFLVAIIERENINGLLKYHVVHLRILFHSWQDEEQKTFSVCQIYGYCEAT